MAIEDKSKSEILCAKTFSSSLGSHSPINSVSCHADSYQSNQSSPFLSAMNTLEPCTSIDTHEKELNGVLQRSLDKASAESRKRVRPFSWQRRRKRRQVNFTKDNAVTSCVDTKKYEDNLSEEVQHNSNTSLNQHTQELSCLEPEKQHAPCIHPKMVSL